MKSFVLASLLAGPCINLQQRVIDSPESIPYVCFRQNLEISITPANARVLLDTVVDPISVYNIVKTACSTGRADATEMIRLLNATEDFHKTTTRPASDAIVDSLGGPASVTVADIQAFEGRLLLDMSDSFVLGIPEDSFYEFVSLASAFVILEGKSVLNVRAVHSLCHRYFKLNRFLNTTALIENTGPFIVCAPTDVCREASREALVGSMETVEELDWNCGSFINDRTWAPDRVLHAALPLMKSCGFLLYNRLDHSSTTSSDFDSYCYFGSCINAPALNTLLQNASCTEVHSIGQRVNMVKNYMRTYYDKCFPTSLDPASPGTMVKDDFLELLVRVVEYDTAVLDAVDKNEFCQENVLKEMKDTRSTSIRMRQYAAKACLADAPWEDNSVQMYGAEAVFRLPLSKLIEGPTVVFDRPRMSHLAFSILTLSTDDKRVRVIRRVVQDKMTWYNLLDWPEIAKEIPQYRVETAVVSDVITDLSLDNIPDVDIPYAKNRFIVDKYLEMNDMTTLDLPSIRLLREAVRGLLSSQIKQMACFGRDDQFVIAAALCQFEKWFTKPANAILRELIVPSLQELNETNYMSAITPAMINVIGPNCLLHFSPAELVVTSQESCAAICERIGESKGMLLLRYERRVALKDACLTCLGKYDTSAQITDDDLEILGPFLASVMTTELSRVDPAAFRTKMHLFRPGCLSIEALSAVGDVLQSIFGPASGLTMDDIYEIGNLLTAYAQGGTLGDINARVLLDTSYFLLEELHPTSYAWSTFQEACYRSLPASDGPAHENLKSEIHTIIFNAFGTDGSAWSCEDIRYLGPAIKAAPLATLMQIDSNEFYKCLVAFSKYTDWEVDKRDALLQKVKDDVGPLCDLPPMSIVNLAHLSYSMSEADIGCMPMDSDDVVAAFGFFNGWTLSQSRGLAQQYMTNRSVTLDSLNGLDLSILNNILTGFTAAELQLINRTAFVHASSVIGRLTPCPYEALVALKDIAVSPEAFGPISTWSTATYADLGSIIGGFTAAELQTLTEDILEVIPAHAIALIPASNIQAFTAAQYEFFSEEQILSLTVEQRAGLSQAQLNAIPTFNDGLTPVEPIEPVDSGSTEEPGTPGPGSEGTKAVGYLSKVLACVLTVLILSSSTLIGG